MITPPSTLSRLAMAMLLVVGPLSAAWAHPDANSKQIQSVAPPPGGPPNGSPAEAAPPLRVPQRQAPAEDPNAAFGRAPGTAANKQAPGLGATQARPKVWFHDQRKAGYQSNVSAIVVQAAHAHFEPQERLDYLPVEIWYVATSKRVGPSEILYCVSPRIENPASIPWENPIEVRLHKDGPNSVPVKALVVVPVPPGASREIPTDMTWCVKADQRARPKMILETDHGSAMVALPAPPKPGN